MYRLFFITNILLTFVNIFQNVLQENLKTGHILYILRLEFIDEIYKYWRAVYKIYRFHFFMKRQLQFVGAAMLSLGATDIL
jgi:hypothetical protein